MAADRHGLLIRDLVNSDLPRLPIRHEQFALRAECQGSDFAQVIQDLRNGLAFGREDTHAMVLMPNPDLSTAVHRQCHGERHVKHAAGFTAELVVATDLAGQGVGCQQQVAGNSDCPQRLLHQLGVGRRRIRRDLPLRPLIDLDVASLVGDLGERFMLAIGLAESL